ncbi:cytochrome P450, putative [Talaromyces stipitatus ATCC 10500]|uniref:Cytochrome P450, putative n=1 Tax=Talaromyces stipitatus (strain ATCC 10500 / CBS 375.48 / QM 6759 / NRRL 1006) TaxID=441959 RepID=B8MHQ8_TALSN|nr:cytochrome P450, putative [Talaromyces stipitatus ATCC 10500]EED16388.1 cytochrome P450, putative [Talaromyces stipitatus ATCC 10500]
MGYISTSRPSVEVGGAIAAAYLLYLVGLVVYRLYYSPLAKFPGPKLAAASKWYEFYYDVVKRGQFTFQIQRMHKKYGPIVRINPFEVHIQDSRYWDELYTGHKEYERYAWMSGRFGANTATSSTVSSHLHYIRRAPLDPMFSKRSITKFEPIVHEMLEKLSKGIAAYKDSGRILAFNDAFNSLREIFHAAYEAVRKFAHFGLQFPSVFIVLGLSPRALLKTVAPNMFKMFVLQKDLQDRIANIIHNEKVNSDGNTTIFDALLKSNLPPPEKTMIGAGVETVAWALTTTVFHLLDNSKHCQRLRSELQEAIPNPAILPKSVVLEKLPYLAACVKEGIRLSTGVSVRLPRVSPEKPIQYGDWVIPPGTPVSMTTLDVLRDEKVFPDASSFIPERWLDGAKTEEGESLSRYFVPFGKGPRMCIGVNLAYIELHLTLAMLFRRFEFELYETDITDVELAHDFMVPQPKLDTKGMRVRVTGLIDW